MAAFKNLTGMQFSSLTVIGEAPKANVRMWLCRCKCGAEITVRRNNLLSGHTQSCGCQFGRKVPGRLTPRGVPFEDHFLIPLSRGLFAKVSGEDLEIVQAHNWHARTIRGRTYAIRTVKINGKRLPQPMQVLIISPPKGFTVDHIDGPSTLDNRRCNLRLATISENGMNRRAQSNNKSGYKGVYFHRGNWFASIQAGDKRKYMGPYPSKEQAALAYNSAAVELHGEFAALNEPLPAPERMEP